MKFKPLDRRAGKAKGYNPDYYRYLCIRCGRTAQHHGPKGQCR